MAGRVPLPGLACGHGEGRELGRERPTVQCAACERQVSVTAGTVLHGSHLGLRTWFLAAWLMATHANGISARQLWKQLGLGSYKTAWLLLRKLRRAMVDPEREPLAGLVEVEAGAGARRAATWAGGEVGGAEGEGDGPGHERDVAQAERESRQSGCHKRAGRPTSGDPEGRG